VHLPSGLINVEEEGGGGALVEVKWPYKNGTTVCQNINEKKN